MKIEWFLDEHLLSHISYKNNLIKILTDKKIPYQIINNYLTKNVFNLENIIVPYGTIGFVRKMNSSVGNFLNEKNFTYHNYSANLEVPQELFLNSDGIYTTFRDFRVNYKNFFEFFDSEELFLRPDSCIKLFSGFSLKLSNIKDEINYLKKLSSLNEESLILVASSKKIRDETRFILTKNKIISSSRYKIDNDSLIEDNEFPKELEMIANAVSQSEWIPEDIFVCDIGMTIKGPRIIELNSVSTSGWYACDIEKIIDAINKISLERYKLT